MDKTCPECGARVHLGGYTIEKHDNELEYVAFENGLGCGLGLEFGQRWLFGNDTCTAHTVCDS